VAGVSLVDLGYAAGWRLVRTVPLPLAAAAVAAGADRMYRRGGPGVRRLRENLRHVVGPDVAPAELDELVRRGLRSYARYLMEAFRLPRTDRAGIRRRFRLDGEEVLAAEVAAGRGVVIALPHGGNWDAAGAWVTGMGWPLTTVAERLKPESVYRRYVEFREGLGMEIIPLTGGEQNPLGILADRLGKGHVVPLLADRDLSRSGVPVTFFGQPTRMPPGPALLALRTGAPLYTADMWFEPDSACARLVGPVELPGPESGSLSERVAVVTQRIADRLAAGIARHPEDWHMLQRMWLTEPAGRRRVSGPPSGSGPA
jgi:lauroyl/myristoyl acyltransferase